MTGYHGSVTALHVGLCYYERGVMALCDLQQINLRYVKEQPPLSLSLQS